VHAFRASCETRDFEIVVDGLARSKPDSGPQCKDTGHHGQHEKVLVPGSGNDEVARRARFVPDAVLIEAIYRCPTRGLWWIYIDGSVEPFVACTGCETDGMRNPGTAAVLSAIIPGIGQFYNRDFLRGIFWLIVTPGMWIGTGGLLGWVCHVIAAMTAFHGANAKNPAV